MQLENIEQRILVCHSGFGGVGRIRSQLGPATVVSQSIVLAIKPENKWLLIASSHFIGQGTAASLSNQEFYSPATRRLDSYIEDAFRMTEMKFILKTERSRQGQNYEPALTPNHTAALRIPVVQVLSDNTLSGLICQSTV